MVTSVSVDIFLIDILLCISFSTTLSFLHVLNYVTFKGSFSNDVSFFGMFLPPCQPILNFLLTTPPPQFAESAFELIF